MLKKKITVTILIALILLLFLSVGAFLLFYNFGRPNGDLDLSDVEEINIGSELPSLRYGDDDIAVIQSTFGVIVFDFKEEAVIDRISYETVKELGINDALIVSVSADGKTVYLNNHDFSNGADPDTFWRYDLDKRRFYEISKLPEEIISFDSEPFQTTFEVPEPRDPNYIVTSPYIKHENKVIYLRISDWNAKNLQICVYRVDTETQEIFDVFDFSEKTT